MKSNILLSILTPTIPDRREQLALLEQRIASTTPEVYRDNVQHLSLCDNRVMSIGKKREALVRSASGLYVAFVDDDDWVKPDYVEELLLAIDEDLHRGGSAADVITFEQDATYNDHRSRIIFRLRSKNKPFVSGGVTLRAAWHICAWRRELAVQFPFPDTNYGEDWAWAHHLNIAADHERHIDKVLHYYRHSAATTAAPEPIIITQP